MSRNLNEEPSSKAQFSVSEARKLYARDLIELNDSKFFLANMKNLINFGNSAPVLVKSSTFGKILRYFYSNFSSKPTLFGIAKGIFGVLPFWLQRKIQKEIFASKESSSNLEPFFDFDLGFGINTSETPLVSIIIPAHDGWYVTIRCLKAIQACQDKTTFEIIVVDDKSRDETSEILRNIRGIRVVTNLENMGYLKSTNIGAMQAKGRYLLLLNNDTEPTSGWMDSLVETLENNPNAVIAGSSLIYPSRKLQEAGSQIFEDGKAAPIGRGKSPASAEYLFRKQVDFCSAASVLIRSNFWQDSGGFDTRYAPAYCEDCDLSLLAWRLGKEVLFDPFSLVYHHESGSHGGTAAGLIHENSKKLSQKWDKDLLWHWENSGEIRNEYFRDSKGIVVLIDYRLPSLLKDSGSIRTIRLARLLKQAHYHVIIAGLDRMTTFADINELRREGIEVHLDLNEMYESLVGRENRLKCFWLIREYVFNQVVDTLRKISPNTFVINDLLDLNYANSEGEVRIKKDQVKALEDSDLTVLVSPYESRILSENKSNTKVLDLWKPFQCISTSTDFSERRNVLFVGGFRHLPNVEGIFWFVDEVLPEVRDRLGLSVQVVGTGLSKLQSDYLIKSGVEVLGGVEDLSDLYEQSRVVVVPLQSGSGMKGKLAEALAHGVPVVTTSIGAEGYDFQETDLVEICDSPKEFGLSVLKLATDQNYFKNARKAAYEYIERGHSETAIMNKLGLIIQEFERKN